MGLDLASIPSLRDSRNSLTCNSRNETLFLYDIGTTIELEERSFLYVVKRSMCLPPIYRSQMSWLASNVAWDSLSPSTEPSFLTGQASNHPSWATILLLHTTWSEYWLERTPTGLKWMVRTRKTRRIETKKESCCEQRSLTRASHWPREYLWRVRKARLDSKYRIDRVWRCPQDEVIRRTSKKESTSVPLLRLARVKSEANFPWAWAYNDSALPTGLILIRIRLILLLLKVVKKWLYSLIQFAFYSSFPG